MPLLLVFLTSLAISLVAARLRRWPFPIAVTEGLGFAVALSLVAFGEDLAIAYPIKAAAVALGAAASTWAFGHMGGRASPRGRGPERLSAG